MPGSEKRDGTAAKKAPATLAFSGLTPNISQQFFPCSVTEWHKVNSHSIRYERDAETTSPGASGYIRPQIKKDLLSGSCVCPFMTQRMRASLSVHPTCHICLTLVPVLVPFISLILHLRPPPNLFTITQFFMMETEPESSLPDSKFLGISLSPSGHLNLYSSFWEVLHQGKIQPHVIQCPLNLLNHRIFFFFCWVIG